MKQFTYLILILTCVTLVSLSVDASSGRGAFSASGSGTRYNGISERKTNNDMDNVETPTIDSKLSQEQVKVVQLRLNELGYECGIADGIIGNRTVAAVKMYQRKHNLEQNGVLDEALLDILQSTTHQGIEIADFIDRYNVAIDYYNQFEHDYSKITVFPAGDVESLMIKDEFLYFGLDPQEDHIESVRYDSSSENYREDDYIRLSCIAYAMNPTIENIDELEHIVRIIKYYYDGNADYLFLRFYGEEGLGNRFDETISYRILGEIIDPDIDMSEYKDDIPKAPETETEKIQKEDTEEIQEEISTAKMICEVDNCKKEGTKALTGVSGQIEYYCEQHYQEMMSILDMMEEDVGNSNYSEHTCYVDGCNKEGTNQFNGYAGSEYYCTQHYDELVSMFENLSKE